MSIDAGGLAQVTFSHNNFTGGLGLPPSGFASRGKGSNIKRISVAPPSRISSIDENSPVQPRTSRSHLLAGLRTAPRSPTFNNSPSRRQLAPETGCDQRQHSRSEVPFTLHSPPEVPTCVAAPATHPNHYNVGSIGQVYSPDQVLAPPAIHIASEQGDGQMDPNLYEELVRTNQFLAQRQQQLQRQLINVTAAAQQQFQGVSAPRHQQQGHAPWTPRLGFYGQQVQHSLQPVDYGTHDFAGYHTVYDPMTGQVNCFVNHKLERGQHESAHLVSHMDLSHSPPPSTPSFCARVSSPPNSVIAMGARGTDAPSKRSPTPPHDEVNPLPPHSANAFCAAHRKCFSLVSSMNGLSLSDPARNAAGLKSATFPPTPSTGTFGPGQARAGEHPIRQPRGPPSLEELVAKPTTSFEGSKNFAARQRRRAVHNLVRAEIERRIAPRGNGSTDSIDCEAPFTEIEIPNSDHSDPENCGYEL